MKHVTLLCREWLADYTGERLPVTEPELAPGLKPLIGWSEPEPDELGMKVAAILRSGGVFVLDVNDRPLWQEYIPFEEGLPPLPYPRLWIEATNNGTPAPLFVKYGGDEEEQEVDSILFTMGILVNEVKRGERWELIHLDFAPDENDPLPSEPLDPEDVYERMLGSNAVIYRESIYDVSVSDPPPTYVEVITGETRLLPYHSPVMLLDLLGAIHQPVPTVRQERRQFERKFGWRPATAYYVNLRSTGDEPSVPGNGSKKFGCRWLVRGHYARHRYGDIWRENKQAWCVWVRPYIKGPVGAPWKGRPIYLNLPDEEAA